MEHDNSLEFDMFESVRHNLTEVLMRAGHDEIEAERAALYLVQGVRDVPRLITALARGNRPDAEVLRALRGVLESAGSLEKARDVLLGLGAGSREADAARGKS